MHPPSKLQGWGYFKRGGGYEGYIVTTSPIPLVPLLAILGKLGLLGEVSAQNLVTPHFEAASQVKERGGAGVTNLKKKKWNIRTNMPPKYPRRFLTAALILQHPAM